MNLHLIAGIGVKFTGYEGKMMKEVAQTSSTLYDAHRSLAHEAQ